MKKIVLLILMVILNLFQNFCFGQKTTIEPICLTEKFAKQHTTDTKWNTLLDVACEEMNKKNYFAVLEILEEAVKIDSSNAYINMIQTRVKRYLGIDKVFNKNDSIDYLKAEDKLNKNSKVLLFSSFFKLSEINGQVSTHLLGKEGIDLLKDVKVEVRENETDLIETCLTDENGIFFLKKLRYETSYKISFLKEGYYTRFIWVNTYNVPDSLKEIRFRGYNSVQISLKEVLNKEIENPFERGQSTYSYRTIEMSAQGSVGSKKLDRMEKKDSLFIKKGGIIKDENYSKQVKNLELEIEQKLLVESNKKNKKQISEFEMMAKVQQLENAKIQQDNKLKEFEISKEKALASAKENELAMVKQDQKIKEIKEQEKDVLQKAEQEKKEATHKAQLKQNTIILYSVLAGLFIVLVFAGFVVRSLRVRNKQNKIIVEQKNVVEKQKEVVEQQKHLVEEKNREITDSISYALRIQTAILPPTRIVKQYLENSFILYKPKDIVAGDFYWMETVGITDSKLQIANSATQSEISNPKSEIILFAACDCTGHGVPGAMVSVVCHNALNRAVREYGLTQPAAILDKTAEIVIENFSKSEESIKDGMDISLCNLSLNPTPQGEGARTYTLQWAGANNPLWIVRNTPSSLDTRPSSLLEETKADKQPIGMNEDSKPFTNHTFTLNSGDTIYLFTDGFADQFGGETGEKKLTRKRFKDLLLSIQHLSMSEQGVALDKFIVEYRKEVEQIDDILVMGVRV